MKDTVLLKAVLDSIDQGIIVLDDDWCLVAWSERYLEIMAMPRDWLWVGRPWREIGRLMIEHGEMSVGTQEVEAALDAYMTRLGRDTQSNGRHRFVRHRANGRYVEIMGRAIKTGGRAFTIADVTERELASREIERLAWTDTLTGLKNRNCLISELRHTELEREGARWTLFLLDLDRFKHINDTYGHAAGDIVLVNVAQRIRAAVGEGVSFRLGGDEFAIIVRRAMSQSEIKDLAARLVRDVQQPVLHDGRALTVGTSVGIGIYPDHADQVEDLLRVTDIALYEAKQAGRGRFAFYNATVARRVQKERRTEDGLAQAIEKTELFLEYQPIVEGRTFGLIGAEAMVRWRHPQRGVLQPNEFIAVLERSDMVFDVGAFVLWDAWQQLERWDRDYPDKTISVSVNISLRQFFDEKFFELLQDIALRNPGLTSRLELEIKEDFLVEDVARVSDLLQAIEDLGFPVAVDDFGTGRSSISYLADLPVRNMKVDRSFLPRRELDTNQKAILNSIVQLGHGIGMGVTVEGVEYPEQAAFLQTCGCDCLQGFLFGRPLPVQEFEDMLRAPDHLRRVRG